MTRTQIQRHSDNIVITVKGHAGYDPGKDIVCASISTLCYALINAFEKTDCYLDYSDMPGDFYILVRGLSPEAKCMLKIFTVGMKMIAEHFPQNLICEGYDEIAVS